MKNIIKANLKYQLNKKTFYILTMLTFFVNLSTLLSGGSAGTAQIAIGTTCGFATLFITFFTSVNMFNSDLRNGTIQQVTSNYKNRNVIVFSYIICASILSLLLVSIALLPSLILGFSVKILIAYLLSLLGTILMSVLLCSLAISISILSKVKSKAITNYIYFILLNSLATIFLVVIGTQLLHNETIAKLVWMFQEFNITSKLLTVSPTPVVFSTLFNSVYSIAGVIFFIVLFLGFATIKIKNEEY